MSHDHQGAFGRLAWALVGAIAVCVGEPLIRLAVWANGKAERR